MSQHCRANPCCGDRPCSGIPLPQHASGLPAHNKPAKDSPASSLRGQLKEAENNINLKADFIEATVNQLAEANDSSDHWRAHVGSLLAVIQYMTEATGEGPDDEDAAMVAQINSEYEASNA